MQVEHILQRPPLGDVIKHVVGRDQGQPHRFGQCREMGQAARIVAAIEMVGGEIAAAGNPPLSARQAEELIRGRRLGGSRTTICPSPCAATSA